MDKTQQVFKDRFSWEEKAKQNPLFAVMSVERFADKSSNPKDWTEEDLQAFFGKGQFVYDVFLRPVIQRIPLQPESALIVEYGSGMGRILKAVKAAGFECCGIDISPTMLGYSRQLVLEVQNLAILDEHGRCDIPTGSADFVYSYAVIQHIPKLSDVQVAIDEMGRILKPGGTLKLQFLSLDSLFRSFARGGRFVCNFESRSLIVECGKVSNGYLFGRLPPLPKLYSRKHTNWVGVPLPYRTLQRFLNDGGLRLLGIEEDIGHKNMAWALARKES